MLPIEQFHPLVVHFPIVFTLTLVAFDSIASLRGANIGGRGVVGNISAGLAVVAGLAGAAAFIFGDIALDVALSAGGPVKVLETHEEFGKITAAVLVGWAFIRAFLWYRDVSIRRFRKAAIVFIELVAAVLIITTAYFGGRLVYDFGVGVTHAIGG